MIVQCEHTSDPKVLQGEGEGRGKRKRESMNGGKRAKDSEAWVWSYKPSKSKTMPYATKKRIYLSMFDFNPTSKQIQDDTQNK